MKRQGNLIDKIADWNNLSLAFWKARKGKNAKIEVQNYRRNLQGEILSLRADILSDSVRTGDYYYFTVHDPKKRQICAASFRERVLHHAIINICDPFFESYLIFDTYACRRGKGSHRAVDRAQNFSRRNRFYLKLDIAKYFDSINHVILMHLLEKRFKDKYLLVLLKKIIESYETSPGKGVPIGNLTSQYFANHYLGALDHFIKEQLCIRHYVRYMDDFIVWSDDRNELKDYLKSIRYFLREMLSLELNDTIILNQTAGGVGFLGYRVFPDTVMLTKRSKARFIKKYQSHERNYLYGKWEEADLAVHINPLIAFTKHANAHAFRKNTFERYGAVS
ncbi:MAG: reverse transcriptase/maturase family protein [Pseudomonadota bacterium]